MTKPPAPHFTIPPASDVRVAPALQRRVIARDRFACVYCGASESTKVRLHVDHVRPCAHFPATALRAQVNAPTNLVTACADCNAAKGPQDLDGFARMLRARGLDDATITAMTNRVRAAVLRPLP